MNYVDINILVYVCDAHEYIFSVEYRQRSKTDESQGMHKYRFITYELLFGDKYPFHFLSS